MQRMRSTWGGLWYHKHTYGNQIALYTSTPLLIFPSERDL